MIKRGMGFLVLGAFLGLVLASAAQAAPFENGNFSTGNYVAGQNTSSDPRFMTLPAGSTTINGWTVTGDSVDWIGNSVDYTPVLWVAPGAPPGRSIDLDGNNVGGLQQTFTTTPGQSYTVTFALSGNPGGNVPPYNLNPVKTLQVSAGGNSQTFVINTSGWVYTTILYAPESFSFTAPTGSTTLSFVSLDTPISYCGPVIANVTVNPVPVPATLLLLGPGVAGLAAIRRRLK